MPSSSTLRRGDQKKGTSNPSGRWHDNLRWVVTSHAPAIWATDSFASTCNGKRRHRRASASYLLLLTTKKHYSRSQKRVCLTRGSRMIIGRPDNQEIGPNYPTRTRPTSIGAPGSHTNRGAKQLAGQPATASEWAHRNAESPSRPVYAMRETTGQASANTR